VRLRAHRAFLATAAHDSHALNPSDSWVVVLSAVACSAQDKTRSTGRHLGHSTFELAGRWLVCVCSSTDGTKNPARMCCPSLFRSAPQSSRHNSTRALRSCACCCALRCTNWHSGGQSGKPKEMQNQLSHRCASRRTRVNQRPVLCPHLHHPPRALSQTDRC
jgi:hypothetical protein